MALRNCAAAWIDARVIVRRARVAKHCQALRGERRLMLAAPPAIIDAASPLLMARAALPEASRPEPQGRFSVNEDALTGMPVSRRSRAPRSGHLRRPNWRNRKRCRQQRPNQHPRFDPSAPPAAQHRDVGRDGRMRAAVTPERSTNGLTEIGSAHRLLQMGRRALGTSCLSFTSQCAMPVPPTTIARAGCPPARCRSRGRQVQ